MTDELVKWGDAQQYHAEPHDNYDPQYGVVPSVTLLWMTPRPLDAIAAMSEMYKGNVIRNLDEITSAVAEKALEDVQQTHLQAPLEAVKLHFMIEGVDRAFTHQLVRQRTAVYAQESMRFAVLDDLVEGTSLPPSLHGTEPMYKRDKSEDHIGGVSQAQGWRDTWDYAINQAQASYQVLVNQGMPAEEARGLLPHATATRLNYVTDLRNLVDHAGNRLCTQAQFHWRLVFGQIVKAIREFGADDWGGAYAWQAQALANSNMFRPKCYQLGHCPFKASFDRECSIRERVDEFAKHGVPSSEWSTGSAYGMGGSPSVNLKAINDAEWFMNPDAARVRD